MPRIDPCRRNSPYSPCVCGETVPSNEPCLATLTPVSLQNTVDLHVSEEVKLGGKLGIAQVALFHFSPM